MLNLYQMRRIDSAIEDNPAEFENFKNQIGGRSNYYRGLID